MSHAQAPPATFRPAVVPPPAEDGLCCRARLRDAEPDAPDFVCTADGGHPAGTVHAAYEPDGRLCRTWPQDAGFRPPVIGTTDPAADDDAACGDMGAEVTIDLAAAQVTIDGETVTLASGGIALTFRCATAGQASPLIRALQKARGRLARAEACAAAKAARAAANGAAAARITSYMACGDTLDDDQFRAPGDPGDCQRHGPTSFITREQWLDGVPPELEVSEAGHPTGNYVRRPAEPLSVSLIDAAEPVLIPAEPDNPDPLAGHRDWEAHYAQAPNGDRIPALVEVVSNPDGPGATALRDRARSDQIIADQVDASRASVAGHQAGGYRCDRCGTQASYPAHSGTCDRRFAGRIWASSAAVRARQDLAEYHAHLSALPGGHAGAEAHRLREQVLVGQLAGDLAAVLAEIDLAAGASHG